MVNLRFDDRAIFIALIFRQDYRINKIFCLSGLRPIGAYPPACMSYGQEAAPAGRKAKRIIPLRVKSFTHYLKKAVKPSEKHPLLIHRPFFR